jgi:DNA gyrase subunit A
MARKNKIDEESLKIKQKKFEKVADNLELLPADKFLKDNFLPYAWSYNLDRALVDVTGLKPVQRRILYSMFKDGLKPAAHRAKVATLAGRVLAFHPHGDASVADALKNLARPHIFRVPLIDGKGDFGVPGTPGAAGRYIEARLNQAAWLNVEEIEEHAVHMVPNYDGSLQEPVKIPVKWPVSVINGGAGIAIAYSSTMPSHNPTEIMKALKATLRNPDITHAALQKIILGPDFNMGGLITSNDGIKEYLETGSGSFRVRGQYEVTSGARGTSRIEFYEIPFGTNPEKILEDIQKAVGAGNLKELANYKDLSDLKHPIRVVIETKPSVNPKKVIQDLFKYTSLEVSFSANITTIVDNKPKKSSMKELLLDFIEFRKMCVTNKTHFALGKRHDRLHLVGGLLKTLLDIDKAISIIRNSDDTTVAQAKLMKQFKIDEKQADYVLALQLRRLTKMDKVQLENERKELEEAIAKLELILSDEDALKAHLLEEFDATLKVIGDERKTDINGVSAEEFAANEKTLVRELKTVEKNQPCYVTRFATGKLLVSLQPFEYAEQAQQFEHGPILETVKMNTHDSIVLVGSDGIGRKVPLSYIPLGKVGTLKDAGLTVPRGVTLVGISKVDAMKSDVGLALATKQGLVKIAKTDFPLKEEFPVITLEEGDSVIDSRWIGRTLSASFFTFVTAAGNILVFDATTVRVSGSKAGGVRGVKLKDTKDEVIAFSWLRSIKAGEAQILSQGTLTLKLTPIEEIPTKGKGAMGVALHLFKKGETKLKNAYVGPAPAIGVPGMASSVMLPPAVKRASRGVDFTLDTVFGSRTVAPM